MLEVWTTNIKIIHYLHPSTSEPNIAMLAARYSFYNVHYGNFKC